MPENQKVNPKETDLDLDDLIDELNDVVQHKETA